jgi:hypothetical protein
MPHHGHHHSQGHESDRNRGPAAEHSHHRHGDEGAYSYTVLQHAAVVEPSCSGPTGPMTTTEVCPKRGGAGLCDGECRTCPNGRR